VIGVDTKNEIHKYEVKCGGSGLPYGYLYRFPFSVLRKMGFL
jgi:hypothetical protein